MEDLPSCTKQEDCNSIPLTYCNTTSGKCECMLNFMPLANPTAGCTPAQCNPNSAPAGVCGAGLVCVGGSCVSSACLDYSASGCHLCASSPALDSEPSSLPEGRSCRSGQAKHNLKAPCGACSASCPSGTCTTPNTYCLPNPSDPTVWSCQAATSCSSAADCPDPNMCCLDGGCVAPVCSGTCVGPCPAGQVCSMTFNPPPNPPTFQCRKVQCDANHRGSAYSCPQGKECTDEGTCAYSCKALGWVCGSPPTPSTGPTSCGTCPTGYQCEKTAPKGQCIGQHGNCLPRQCGPAGSGCPACPTGMTCGGEASGWPRFCIPTNAASWNQQVLMNMVASPRSCPDYISHFDSLAASQFDCYQNAAAVAIGGGNELWKVEAYNPADHTAILTYNGASPAKVEVQTAGRVHSIVPKTHMVKGDRLHIPVAPHLQDHHWPLEVTHRRGDGTGGRLLVSKGMKPGSVLSTNGVALGDPIVQGIASTMPIGLTVPGSQEIMPGNYGNLENQTNLQVLYATSNVKDAMSPSQCGISVDHDSLCDAFGGGIPCQPGTVPVPVSGATREDAWLATPPDLVSKGAPPYFSVWSCAYQNTCPDGWYNDVYYTDDAKPHFGCNRVPLPSEGQLCHYDLFTSPGDHCKTRGCASGDAATQWAAGPHYQLSWCDHGNGTSCNTMYVKDLWSDNVPVGYVYTNANGTKGICKTAGGCTDIARCWKGSETSASPYTKTWHPVDDSHCS